MRRRSRPALAVVPPPPSALDSPLEYQRWIDARQGYYSGDAEICVRDESFLARGRLDARERVINHQTLNSDWDKPGKLKKPGATSGLVNRRISDRSGYDVFTGSVDKYVRDTKIRFKMRDPSSRPGGGRRGRVVGLSKSSRRNAVFTLRNKRLEVRWKAFITLTYPAQHPGADKVKLDLQNWLKRLRRLTPDVNYFWVLELQERGAFHIHLLVDKWVDKHWLSRSWFEVVGSGDERHLRAGTSVEVVRHRNKIVSYLLSKYLSKQAQKDFEGWTGRVWGASRGLVALPDRIPLGGNFRDMARATRPLRKLLISRFPPWKWKGGGFTLYDVQHSTVERLLEAGTLALLN